MSSSFPAVHTAEAAVAALTGLSGVAAVLASRTLPAPVLEPVGPAAFPFWVGIALIVLSALMALRVLISARHSTAASRTVGDVPDAPFRRRGDLALQTAVATIAYMIAMQSGWVGFRAATVVYIFALTLVLAGWNWRCAPGAALLALICGVGLHHVFTGFFYIDLPG